MALVAVFVCFLPPKLNAPQENVIQSDSAIEATDQAKSLSCIKLYSRQASLIKKRLIDFICGLEFQKIDKIFSEDNHQLNGKRKRLNISNG